MSQRTVTTSDETQEEPGQEAPYRVQSLCVALPVPPILPLLKIRIKWPPACKTTFFDENVNKVLEASVRSRCGSEASGNDDHHSYSGPGEVWFRGEQTSSDTLRHKPDGCGDPQNPTETEVPQEAAQGSQ